jgi:hypothetical protein
MPVRMSSVKEMEGKCLGEVSWKRFRKPKTCSQFKKIKGEKGKNLLLLRFYFSFREYSFLKNLTTVLAKSLRLLYSFFCSVLRFEWVELRLHSTCISKAWYLIKRTTITFLLFISAWDFRQISYVSYPLHNCLIIGSHFPLIISLTKSSSVCYSLGLRGNHEWVTE